MGQQFFTIRIMPAPGSEAEKKYRARINAKRARKGLPSLEEEERADLLFLKRRSCFFHLRALLL